MRTGECSSAPFPVQECFVKILQWHMLVPCITSCFIIPRQYTPPCVSSTHTRKCQKKNMPTNAWSHCSQNGEPPKIHKHKPGLVESSGCGFIQNIGYQLPDSVFQPLFDRIYMLAGGMVPITSNISKHSVVSIMFDLKSTRVDSALALGSNQSTWISC